MKPFLLTAFAASGLLTSPAPAADADLLYREDFRETPAAIPITQAHIATPGLRLFLHGPGLNGIKKSHHDDKKNDPWYLWSGRCEGNWAVSFSYSTFLDLSVPDARIHWRTKQQGGRNLHLLLKLPGDRWFVSNESSPSSDDWTDHELKLSELTWSYFNVVSIAAEEKVEAPNLTKVDEIGFTDLEPGGGSKACSRLDWIEVHGSAIARPARKPSPVKITRVDPVLPEGVTAHENLVFASYGQRQLALDLYHPSVKKNETPAPLPAVVFIHGGGFYKGTPASYTPMAQKLAAAGYVTANIHYRLAGEAPFPAAIQDCKAAVRFLRANAKDYHLDPKRIGCVGGSAGGVLSGLLGTSAGVESFEGKGGNPDHSSAVQASVVMAGSMDFTSEKNIEQAATDPRRRVRTFLGGTYEEVPDQYRNLSALTFVSKDDPPMCFMDGEFDAPGTRYNEIRPILKEYGIHTEEHVIKNSPHPFWGSNPFFDPTLDIVLEFFDAHLRAEHSSAP